MNKVFEIGRLVATPELKKTPNGVSVTTFSIAVQRDYTPKGSDKITDFFDVVAWSNNADYICKYAQKGDKVAIDGALQARTYEERDTGKKRKIIEINCNRCEIVSSSGVAQQSADAYADDFSEISDEQDLPF